jgi:hypothetical protein
MTKKKQNDNIPDSPGDDTPDLPWEPSDLADGERSSPDDWTDAPDSIADADGEEKARHAARLNVITLARSSDEAKRRLAEIREIPDLVARAKAIRQSGLNEFPEYTEKIVAGKPTTINMSSDRNRWKAFELLFGEDKDSPHRPFYNEFTGYRNDENGETINKQYSIEPLVQAMGELNLLGQNAETVRNAFAEWALSVRRDPLKERLSKLLPEWDGKNRLETSMMDLFECFDTPLNRRMGWYFWTSLYVRVMYGGHNAGIVLSLFGAQNCGKSHFGTRITREIMGDEKMFPTPLDLSGGRIDFLRTITGNSVVAAIPEMTGFTRADLNRVKAFVTNSSDTFDFKFEGSQTMLRRWIILMDGNKYEGLQRDDTGNRRFYPVFCGQLPDKNGKKTWKPAPYQCEMIVSQDRRFEEYMWLCLAEAARWIEENGVAAFDHEVGQVANEVQKFSQNEMDRGSGAVEDSMLATYGVTALLKCQKHLWRGRKENHGRFAVDIKPVEFHQRLLAISKRDAIPSHVDSFFASLGAKSVIGTGARKIYRFYDWSSVEEFEDPHKGILSKIGDADEEGDYSDAKGEAAEDDKSSANGGF